jgi:hypothetical protein
MSIIPASCQRLNRNFLDKYKCLSEEIPANLACISDHEFFDNHWSINYNGNCADCFIARGVIKRKFGGHTMYYNFWISLLSVLIMLGGLGGVLYLVLKKQATINNKMIQFLAITFVLPLLITLGIMNILGRETIGTLLGVVVGFVLSGFGKE